MPLRDHFRPPFDTRTGWEGIHTYWPSEMLRKLFPHLPPDYIAEPGIHIGSAFEVAVAAYQQENWGAGEFDDLPESDADGGGVATATTTLAEPTLVATTTLDDQHTFEVKVFDTHKARQLVAAVELVSPANKDRPENRQALVTKCAAFLQSGVSVCLIDVVTNRHFNLYSELIEFLGLPTPQVAGNADAVYAVSIRPRQRRRKLALRAWAVPLAPGQPLPTLPLWLTESLWVPLELEASYEDTCRIFRLPPPATLPT